MMGVKLTKRDQEILRSIQKTLSIENGRYIDLALESKFDTYVVDILCRVINDEYLIRGIEANYEPNDYGVELSGLLNKINATRLK